MRQRRRLAHSEQQRFRRVVVPTDAICSSSDRTHDALLTLYRERYGRQVETATTEEILRRWP